MGMVQLMLVCLALAGSSPLASASYDTSLCDKYTKGQPETKETPLFLDDFSVELEKTVYKNSASVADQIVKANIEYSKTLRQTLVQTINKKRSDSFVFRADEIQGQCLLERNLNCIRTKDTCTQNLNLAGAFVTIDDGKIKIGTAADSFGWATEETGLKKLVKAADTSVRSIAVNRYIQCIYDDQSDETTVSEFFVMIPSEYKKVNQQLRYILAAKHHRKSPSSGVTEERIDYASQFKLGPKNLAKGLQLPADATCPAIKGSSGTHRMPAPASRFSYTSLNFKTSIVSGMAYTEQNVFHEFNYEAQISRQVVMKAAKGKDEEDDIETVADFWNNREYKLSLVKGTCEVVPNLNIGGRTTMITAREYWGFLSISDVSYLKSTVVRGIPAEVWDIKYNDGKPDFGRMYLAAPSWLRQQDLPANMFYPLKFESFPAGQPAELSMMYEYKENPGYHIPDLSACYEQTDMAHIRLTIYRNYYKFVSDNYDYFAMELRNTIREITGIQTTIRIAKIIPFESDSSPDETTVDFTIFGKYKGYNTTVEDKDPVTSQAAANLIKAQVDKGDFKFKMFNKAKTIRFKPGSFRRLTSLEMEIASSQRAQGKKVQMPRPTGYSSGAMAGVGIGLLFAGLILSVGAVLGYKRYREGPGAGFSFKMGNLSNEDA